MKRFAIVAFAAAVLCVSSLEVPAQTSYPSKPVKLIVPVTTGGPSDLVARILSDNLVANASSAEEFGAFLFSEMGRWKAVLENRKP